MFPQNNLRAIDHAVPHGGDQLEALALDVEAMLLRIGDCWRDSMRRRTGMTRIARVSTAALNGLDWEAHR